MPPGAPFVQSLALKFLEVNQENNKLVVSNRRAVVENSMTEIKRGDVVSGIVKVSTPTINVVSGAHCLHGAYLF